MRVITEFITFENQLMNFAVVLLRLYKRGASYIDYINVQHLKVSNQLKCTEKIFQNFKIITF